MRIHIRNDTYQSVFDKFQSLNSSEITDSLKYDAYYLMRIYFKKEKLFQAAKLFGQIPETHEAISFCAHSKAVVHILLSETKNDSAIAALANCFQAIHWLLRKKKIANPSLFCWGICFTGKTKCRKRCLLCGAVPKSATIMKMRFWDYAGRRLRSRQWNDCISGARNFKR